MGQSPTAGNFFDVPDNHEKRLDRLERALRSEAWHIIGAVGEPAFTNGWLNYDARVARFYKDSIGIVHLNGVIRTGTVGISAFTLPVGYRPNAGVGNNFNFAVPSNGAFGIIAVGSDGTVILSIGSNAWVDISGVHFRAEQ